MNKTDILIAAVVTTLIIIFLCAASWLIVHLLMLLPSPWGAVSVGVLLFVFLTIGAYILIGYDNKQGDNQN